MCYLLYCKVERVQVVCHSGLCGLVLRQILPDQLHMGLHFFLLLRLLLYHSQLVIHGGCEQRLIGFVAVAKEVMVGRLTGMA